MSGFNTRPGLTKLVNFLITRDITTTYNFEAQSKLDTSYTPTITPNIFIEIPISGSSGHNIHMWELFFVKNLNGKLYNTQYNRLLATDISNEYDRYDLKISLK